MRVVDWYLDLNIGQKVVVGVAVAVGLFLATFLATLLILSSSERGEEAPPRAGTPAPASSSASASASSVPRFAVEIERARWKGEKAVVEGSWRGDLSSVHCDLLEGGDAGHAIDWWDRSIAADASFSEGTFSQEFVCSEGRSVKDRIDSEQDYWAVCWAQFSDGGAAGTEAAVRGAPPG